jgi:transposase-like protein
MEDRWIGVWKDHGVLIRHGDFSDVARVLSFLGIPFSWNFLEIVLYELDFCGLGRGVVATLVVLRFLGRISDEMYRRVLEAFEVPEGRARGVEKAYRTCIDALKALETVILCPRCFSDRVVCYERKGGYCTRYRCRSCGRRFRLKRIHYDRALKRRAIRIYLVWKKLYDDKRASLRDVALAVGKSHTTVRFFKKYVEKALIVYRKRLALQQSPAKTP